MDADGFMVPIENWAGIGEGAFDYFPSLDRDEHDICMRRVGDGFMKNRRWAAAIIKEALKYDCFERLPLVQSPTLCIYGAHDWGSGAVGGGQAPLPRLLHGIVGAESAIIENAGLTPPFEQPQSWSRIVLEFLLRRG
jgi:pimeloyl-ACP methyl ester carboxylesterase